MSIVAEVNRLLESDGGRRKLHQLGLIAAKLNSQTDKIQAFLKLARARRTASFYLNASQTSGSHVRLSVRVGGVQCGASSVRGGFGREAAQHGGEAVADAEPRVLRRRRQAGALCAQRPAGEPERLSRALGRRPAADLDRVPGERRGG